MKGLIFEILFCSNALGKRDVEVSNANNIIPESHWLPVFEVESTYCSRFKAYKSMQVWEKRGGGRKEPRNSSVLIPDHLLLLVTLKIREIICCKLKFQVKMISTLLDFSSILLFVFMIMNATQKQITQTGMKSFRPEIHLN